jgi:outer membrane protein OmpA-like peptidoglycan-associated protein
MDVVTGQRNDSLLFWAGLVLGAGLLSGCYKLIPPVTPRVEEFNEAEYTKYLGEGTGTISGEACLWTKNGELVKVPERGVFLWPATKYVTEHLEREVLGGDPLWFAPDARIYHYRRETRSDKSGRFEFEKVPPGEYYLTCQIEWYKPQVPPREEVFTERISRWVFTKVTLGSGEHVRVGVSGPLQPEVSQTPIRESPPPAPPLNITLLDRVLFDSGQATLKPDGRKTLDEIVARLTTLGPGDIRVGGHTDNVPIKGALRRKFADNYELSTARANAVVQYLTEKGVDAARITAKGFADTKPVASNETELGRRKNRRIEIVLVPKGVEEGKPASPEFVVPMEPMPGQPGMSPAMPAPPPTPAEGSGRSILPPAMAPAEPDGVLSVEPGTSPR